MTAGIVISMVEESGGELRLDGDRLLARNITPHLRDAVKAQRAGIIAELRRREQQRIEDDIRDLRGWLAAGRLAGVPVPLVVGAGHELVDVSLAVRRALADLDSGVPFIQAGMAERLSRFADVIRAHVQEGQ